MKTKRKKADANSVFLNFPFEESYKPVFIGVIVGLVALGLQPHCVLEISETGQGRMDRLFGLMAECEASIHDLSLVDADPVRFNMPFELGIAYALKQMTAGKHRFVVMEKEKHRLDKTLSDLKMIDPKIHEGEGLRALHCIYDIFSIKNDDIPLEWAEDNYQVLLEALPELKRKARQKTIFHRLPFKKIVELAMAMALSGNKKAPPPSGNGAF